MLLRNTNVWNSTQNAFCFVLWHCATIQWSPLIHFYVLMQQGTSCLFLPPSHFLPGYYSLTDCLVLPSVTYDFMPMNSTAVWLGRQQNLPKAACWECSPVLELHGTVELLSHTALMGQYSQKPPSSFCAQLWHFTEFKCFLWAKTSGYAMLCDRGGLKEESCTPHLWEISAISFESWYTLQLCWSYFS